MSIDTKELMRQVGKIRFFTKRLVDDRMSGEYHSVFKGHGIEFDEVREYVPGDDIRTIDWNVTARMGHPFIKRFSEERELTVMFLVDVSGSMCFGSGARPKAELAAEVTSLLALAAIKNQDKVGMILFSNQIVKYLPPRKGRTAAMRLVREALAAEETRHGTDIAGALAFLTKVQKRKIVVFLISDFMSGDYEKELRMVARRHDLIVCHLSDPREKDLSDAGVIEVQDPETGFVFIVDTSSAAVRKKFRERAQAENAALDASFKRLKVDSLSLSTDRPYIDDIRRLFRLRQKRAQRM
ncbi:MAG: DUF58 domain-containing protein [Lentisphaerae bacterium]|nr:DUF58 domain-containing protein [Lentisphaerota bacterium]